MGIVPLQDVLFQSDVNFGNYAGTNASTFQSTNFVFNGPNSGTPGLFWANGPGGQMVLTPAAGGGTVTSVAAAADARAVVSWAGSPITGAGTLTPTFALASSSQFGVVKVDGTTITSIGGVISATGGGSLNPNQFDTNGAGYSQIKSNAKLTNMNSYGTLTIEGGGIVANAGSTFILGGFSLSASGEVDANTVAAYFGGLTDDGNFSVVGSSVLDNGPIHTDGAGNITATSFNGPINFANDTGISKKSPANVAIGNGTPGNTTGTLTAGGGLVNSNNLMFWGADPTGIKDSTLAVSNFFNYIAMVSTIGYNVANLITQSNALDFVIPAGTYLITNQIMLTNVARAWIRGAGTSTRFLWNGPSTMVPFLIINDSHCTLSDFNVNATNTHNQSFPFAFWQYSDPNIQVRAAYSGENIYRNINIEGIGAAQYGGGWKIAPSNSVDVQNEKTSFENCGGFNWTNILWYLAGQNCIGTVMRNCFCATATHIGSVGIYADNADFLWETGYMSCDTNVAVNIMPADPITYEDSRTENSSKFFSINVGSQNLASVNGSLNILRSSLQISSNSVCSNYIDIPQGCKTLISGVNISQPANSNCLVGIDYEPQNPYRNSLTLQDDYIATAYGTSFFINKYGFYSGMGLFVGNVDVVSNGITFRLPNTITRGLSHYGGLIETGGGIFVNNAPQPTSPGVAVVGTSGSTTYSYSVTAVYFTGVESTNSLNTTVTTGNASLSSVNYNLIALGGQTDPGIQYFRVYRTAGGATQGFVGTIQNNDKIGNFAWFLDTGLTGSGSTPTSDSTGSITSQGTIDANGALITGPGPVAGVNIGDRATGLHSSWVWAATGDTITLFNSTGQNMYGVSSNNFTTIYGSTEIKSNLLVDGNIQGNSNSITALTNTAGYIVATNIVVTPSINLNGDTRTVWPSGGGSGTVTSVSGAGDGTIFASGTYGTVTTSGTLTLPTPQNQNANTIFAGPSSGGAAAPTFQTTPTFNGTNVQGVVRTNGAQANYEPVYTPGIGVGDISWFPATNVDIVTTATFTNIPPLTYYTNTSGSVQIYSVTISNQVAAVVGNSTYIFAISNSNSGGWSNQTVGLSTLITSIAMNYTNDSIIILNTNAVLAMTNTSTGTGNAAGQVPNTGQLMTIGNATASGVGVLGGNNVWTGNNVFTGANAFTGTVTLGSNAFSSTISNVTEQVFRLGNASNYVANIVFTNSFAASTGMILTNQIDPTLIGGAGTNGHHGIWYMPSGLSLDGTISYECFSAGFMLVTNNGSNFGIATNVVPVCYTTGVPTGYAAYANSTGIAVYITNSSTTSYKEITLESLKPMTR